MIITGESGTFFRQSWYAIVQVGQVLAEQIEFFLEKLESRPGRGRLFVVVVLHRISTDVENQLFVEHFPNRQVYTITNVMKIER